MFVGALAVINTPRRHLPLLCSLTMITEVAKFQTAKDKALSKRLSHYVYRPPTNPVGASDSAKLVQTAQKSKTIPQNVVKIAYSVHPCIPFL